MLLAIDVGNTQTVIGAFVGDELRFRWRFASNKLDTCDELRVKLMSLLDMEGVSGEGVHGVALASVVPKLTSAWNEVAQSLTDKPALLCTAEAAGDLFQTSYPNPHEIGTDRVADAVAARALHGAPVVVVDFGTATNMEVIDADGLFRGGAIAPGMDTAAFALFERASLLGGIHLADPGSVIGRNTEQAMQAGILYGEADRVDGLVSRVFAELGYETPVVATGGLASMVAPHSRTITAVDSDLTLTGLRLVYDRHFDRASADWGK